MKPLPSPEFDENFQKALIEKIAGSLKKPLIVSIMGQTGVGKSSLLKVLFNKVLFNEHIAVDDVYPTTKKPETYTIEGKDGQLLIINDLPGIGESSSADQSHLDTYQKYFCTSDIVLWAFQADNRSTTFDAQALDHLLKELQPDVQAQEQLMSKLVFVLTKADTLLPAPWVMKYNSSSVEFAPGQETYELIQHKQKFFQGQLIQPFGNYIVSRTHNDVNFVLDDDPAFSFDANIVTYRGLLTNKRVEELSISYPKFKKVFERLYDNYCPVPCSAYFRYYLPKLMLVILNKLGSDVVQNFKGVVDLDRLGLMSLDEARQLCNVLIWNAPDSRRIFDLECGIFPDPKKDVVFYKRNGASQHKGPFKKLFGHGRQRDVDHS